MGKLETEAHRLAAQALSQQEEVLVELRARESLSAWIVLALIAFGVSVVLCINVLLPKDGLIFALDAPEVYEALYEVREDEGEIDRRLAYWLQSFREENHPTVKRLTTIFKAAGFALLAEILFLAIALAVS